jgi:beta-glucanase (GH16 family)
MNTTTSRRRRLATSLAAVTACALLAGVRAVTGAPAAHAATPPCGPSPSAVFSNCVFHDDFSGTLLSPTALDGTKWRKINSTATNKAQIGGNCLRNAQVTVGSGQLHLESEIRPTAMTCWGIGATAFQTRLVGASVTTDTKFSHTYGRIEFRAAMPADASLSHTALWMNPDNNTYNPGGAVWPYNGEIDIVERFWFAPSTVATSLHYADKSGAISYTTGDGNPGESLTTCSVTDPENFHTYSAEWTPTLVKFYVDDVLCGTLDWDPANVSPPAPFDQPFNLIASQTAVGVASTPAAGSTRVTHVDWVKFWSY